MLIELAECRNCPNEDFSFPSPIVGSPASTTPTSMDVHLYPDPNTFSTAKPMLYADCEGLDAGEATPRANRRPRRGETRRYAISGGRIRYLNWANNDESRTRNFIVSELYPRLLYTFSDVVVFVLRNVGLASMFDLPIAVLANILIAHFSERPSSDSYSGERHHSRHQSIKLCCRTRLLR
jgi:hypothetical protein